jgi:hypothetical protein
MVNLYWFLVKLTHLNIRFYTLLEIFLSGLENIIEYYCK